MALTHYDGSEVLAKPITLVHVAARVGGERFYVALDVSGRSLRPWRAPIGVFRDDVKEEALGIVAARSGFWSVRLRDVRGLAEMLGPELAEGQSLFEVLQALTMRALKFSREEELLRTWPCGCCGERQ